MYLFSAEPDNLFSSVRPPHAEAVARHGADGSERKGKKSVVGRGADKQ